jgi:hypothetical protein
MFLFYAVSGGPAKASSIPFTGSNSSAALNAADQNRDSATPYLPGETSEAKKGIALGNDSPTYDSKCTRTQ